MAQREFRPIEEFEGFGEEATMNDVADAILTFGPDVLKEDVCIEGATICRVNIRAILNSMELTYSPKLFRIDPAYRRQWEAKWIYDNRRRAA